MKKTKLYTFVTDITLQKSFKTGYDCFCFYLRNRTKLQFAPKILEKISDINFHSKILN
jgi:hypothetical protein